MRVLSATCRECLRTHACHAPSLPGTAALIALSSPRNSPWTNKMRRQPADEVSLRRSKRGSANGVHWVQLIFCYSVFFCFLAYSLKVVRVTDGQGGGGFEMLRNSDFSKPDFHRVK